MRGINQLDVDVFWEMVSKGPWILFPIRALIGIMLLTMLLVCSPFMLATFGLCNAHDYLEAKIKQLAEPVPPEVAHRRAMIEASIVFVCLMICGAAVAYAFLVG